LEPVEPQAPVIITFGRKSSAAEPTRPEAGVVSREARVCDRKLNAAKTSGVACKSATVEIREAKPESPKFRCSGHLSLRVWGPCARWGLQTASCRWPPAEITSRDRIDYKAMRRKRLCMSTDPREHFLHRRHLLCGGGAVVFAAIMTSLLGSCRP